MTHYTLPFFQCWPISSLHSTLPSPDFHWGKETKTHIHNGPLYSVNQKGWKTVSSCILLSMRLSLRKKTETFSHLFATLTDCGWSLWSVWISLFVLIIKQTILVIHTVHEPQTSPSSWISKTFNLKLFSNFCSVKIGHWNNLQLFSNSWALLTMYNMIWTAKSSFFFCQGHLLSNLMLL